MGDSNCPLSIQPIGNQFADTTVWLSIATALAVFRVSKVVEGDVEVTPEVRYTDTLIRYVSRLFFVPFLMMLALQSSGEIQM